jgi:hypothetical protein
MALSPQTFSLQTFSWRTFFDDIVATDRQRSRNRHPPSFDTDKSEFLCPLCRTISNTVIPLIPQFHLVTIWLISHLTIFYLEFWTKQIFKKYFFLRNH